MESHSSPAAACVPEEYALSSRSISKLIASPSLPSRLVTLSA